MYGLNNDAFYPLSIKVVENSPTVYTNSQLYVEYFTSNSVNKDLMVYLPPNYDTTRQYPVIIFYHGDGGKGVFTHVTDQAVGTGNGVQTVFSGNYVCPAGDDVIYSATIKVNGVVVATGTHTGGWSGAGVSSGTNNYTTTNGSFSITFSSPVPDTHAVTISYSHSDLMEDAGTPSYLNAGDEPENVIIVAPQMNVTDFSLSWDYDQLLTHLEANYAVDTNRYYATGLSRGGFASRDIMRTRYATCAAVLVIAANNVTPADWNDNTNMGKFWHHGVTDGSVSYSIASNLVNSNVVNLNIPLDATAYWGQGHSGSVWNTGVYNRRDRTDASGSSLFDYVQWFKKYSLDATQRARLHIEMAEETLDPADYRRALQQVTALTAGPSKTQLEGRLAILYDNIGTIYTIDIVSSGNESAENYNNLTAVSASTVLSDLIDNEAGSSVYDFTVVNALDGSATITAHAELAGKYHGFPRTTNQYGALVNTAVSNGQVKFSSLNDAKTYRVLIYASHYQTGLTTQSQLTVTINATPKSLYTQDNTYHKIEFTGITPSSGEIVIDIDASADRNSRVTAIDLIENP